MPEGSFASWLRGLPLRPGKPDVHLHDGRRKANQDTHIAVLDLDVGSEDLQQCADAVIRLRAEYLFAIGCHDDIRFNFTSGHAAHWKKWRLGFRPEVNGNQVTWHRSAEPETSYASFRRFLDIVFTYAGSASLSQELIPVREPAQPEIGDVFIEGGFPGHAVIVVDVAENDAHERVFLLAQSYMPAQDVHILRSHEEISPWYRVPSDGVLRTPEWDFWRRDLRRFQYTDCEAGGQTRD